MCIGIPMKVVNTEGRQAWCEGRGALRLVDMALVGPQSPGTWVLVFIDGAREVIDERRAFEVDTALDGLAAALRGESVDEYFPDLVNREPELPEFLKAKVGAKT